MLNIEEAVSKRQPLFFCKNCHFPLCFIDYLSDNQYIYIVIFIDFQ